LKIYKSHGGLTSIKTVFIVLTVFLVGTILGCDVDSQRAKDPVIKVDGKAFIPIDNTAFLIPEKSWLVSYGRNSTDGLVAGFRLHASIPDVLPWSPERKEMYRGIGKRLEIRVDGGRTNGLDVQSRRYKKEKFIEETSDLASQGLRRFRELNPAFKEEFYKDLASRRGIDFAEGYKKDAGRPQLERVYYEKVIDQKVNYSISCQDDGKGLFEGCYLYWPFNNTIRVTIFFHRKYIESIDVMANKIFQKMNEFEMAGKAYQLELGKPIKSSGEGV